VMDDLGWIIAVAAGVAGVFFAIYATNRKK